MKHTFSTEDVHFQSAEAVTALLAENCTRTQTLALRRAVDLFWNIRDKPTHYPNALHVAAQLKAMRADVPTVISALLGNNVAAEELPVDVIHKSFGQECAKLVSEVRWLNELSIHDTTRQGGVGTRDQAEMLRRMLLSMVEDIRVVLVKLAFRTQRLYQLTKTDSENREEVARETLAIYAPLANRLGLGQLKWELEDVAFHIVEPQAYKRIAKALEENRSSRESYINDFVLALSNGVHASGISGASVFGRPKHIHSIWKKMREKRIEFTDVFDVRAVRVLVDNLQQCYSVLGIVHSTWQPIIREFDDYIANPKGNGYQSLHTAVIGPGGKAVEVQIRTRAMDDDAENGVAAHWAYKEGGAADESLQRSINQLRHLLDDGDDEQLVEGFSQQLDAQRVYVYTPQGEVIDLVAGATPLDFAYHVHSEIGHRCRGAKVNGSIVPLTYSIQNGDQVEVLTTREPSPSRDWLNKSLGYLASSRARGKVRAWFNTQDHALHLADGRAVLDRELKRLKASSVSIESLAKRLKFEKSTDLFAAIGRNDISTAQIVGAVDHLAEPLDKLRVVADHSQKAARASDTISVRGVGNLLTSISNCCKPVPHDSIVGFITRGKGVTIHRADCSNMLNLPEQERERLIDVDWGDDKRGRYLVELRVIAYDRLGLLRDVSTTLANHQVDVVALNTLSDPNDQTVSMNIKLHVSTIAELTVLMDKVGQLRNVQAVERAN